MMSFKRNGLRVCTLLCSLFVGAAAFADGESVEESARQWFMDVFAKGFIEGDPNFMDYYAEPIYLVVGEDARALSKDDFAAAIDEIYVQPWLAAGWKTTSVISANIEVLANSSARVTASWALLDEKGDNVMGCKRPEWHYLLIKKQGNWRVIADIEGECR